MTPITTKKECSSITGVDLDPKNHSCNWYQLEAHSDQFCLCSRAPGATTVWWAKCHCLSLGGPRLVDIPRGTGQFLFIFGFRSSCPQSSKRITIQFSAEKSQKNRFSTRNWASLKLPLFRGSESSSEIVWFSLTLNSKYNHDEKVGGLGTILPPCLCTGG